MLTLHRSIPLCPDLVVELASPTDGPEALRRKLADYMANGVRLGWLYCYGNNQLSPGAQRSGPVGVRPGVPRPGD
jgi:Uma2 family endonuclease